MLFFEKMNVSRALSVVLILVFMAGLGVPSSYAITLFSGPAPDANTSVQNSDTFILDYDNSATDITLQFGATLNESLKWNSAQNYFELSDDLVINGNTNLNGTVFRLDFDNAGAGATIDIVAEQGSDLDGTLRYNAALNRWEISNDGGGFQAVGTDFESIYGNDADTTLTTSNGILTFNTGTNDFVVDSNDWNVTAAGALDAASITSNGVLTATGTTNLNGAANFNGVTTIGDNGDTVEVNSNSWDISTAGVASGFTGVTSTGAISLGNNTGTVVFDGTNFDVSSSGAVTLTGHLTLSEDATEGISGGGLVDCDLSHQLLQWDATTNKFSCTTAGNDTAAFVDVNPATMADNNTTELFNDATKPNIVADSTSSTILVSVIVSDTNSVGVDDEFDAVRVVRTTDGTDPSCTTSPQVGPILQGGFVTATTHPWMASGTFLDSPGVAGTIKYTICTSNQSIGTVDNVPSRIDVTLVEMGS